MGIKTICITLPELPERTERARNHFEENGLENVIFFDGIHGEKMGLSCTHPYNCDRTLEEGDFFIGYKPTGIFLSHYALWMAMTLLSDEHVHIMEDDCKLKKDWKGAYEQAILDVPSDFDILYLGSCCCQHAYKAHIKGNVYESKSPMCLHSYIVAKKAIPHLLKTNRDCYASIDISMAKHSFNGLKVYVVLPRIANQFDTEIPD